MSELEYKRLDNLARKWLSQARHPQRVNRPEEREALKKCAEQLLTELHEIRDA